MSSVVTEFVLVALGAMVAPTTLTVSVLVLVLGRRPLRTGLWFYAGALGVTVIIGVIGAFAIGNVAASSKSNTPKTPVAVIDVVAALLVLAYVVRLLRRPRDPERTRHNVERVGKITDSPWIAIVGAGAALANPGGAIPLALKDISELNTSTAEYILLWIAFALVSLLPLSLALVALAVAPGPTERVLAGARGWLERHGRTVAAVILILLAAALLRDGIAGLTS